jgi:UDP-2,3-diacylglucosamine hydrolase
MNGSDNQRAASAAQSRSPLGIVSGGGSLPFAVAEAAVRSGRGAVLFGVRGSAEAQRVAAYRHHWVGLGQMGRLCRLARQEGCRDIVFIGTTIRPSLWRLRLDLETLLVLPRLARMFRGGDGHLLTGVVTLMEERGFRVLGAHEVAPDILMPEGPLGHCQANDRARADIARGLALLRAIGPFDVGQAVVVADNHVLAVEAADGTDEMLDHVAEMRRKGRIRSSGGVLVKAPKLSQDRRIDLPTIGPRTVAGAARAGLAGIAVVAREAILAEPDRMTQVADLERIFIVGIPQDRDQP